MKTIINDTSGDLGTAVFYEWHKFIPKGVEIPESDKNLLIENCKSKKVQYKGNRTYASLRDFSEYDFLFNIDKDKFNDKFLINLLDKKSKDLVGKKLDDLEKIEKIMFPTLQSESSGYEDEFFGSTLISNQTFIILNANGANSYSSGIQKIEIYEEGVTSNNNSGGFIEEELLDLISDSDIEKTNSPIITIFLGPGPEIKNNSSDMYFSYDPQLTSKEDNESLSLTDYRKLVEEITMEKAVWILLALNNTVKSINLSYKSWIDSINPNRNMKDYIIRNDEYYSMKDVVKVVEKSKNLDYWYDKNSETLVGNKKISNHPILDRKLKKYKDNASVFSPFAEYSLGDRVLFDKKFWESLSNNNEGNYPTLSNEWTLFENITDIFTSRVVIVPYPNKGGYSNPGGIITVKNNSLISFKIFETSGYSINEENPCSYEIGKNLTDYILTVNRDPSVGNEITLTVSNWNLPISSGKLYINFKQIYSTINLKMSDGIVSVPYEQWSTHYLDDSLKLSKIKINDELKDPEFDENYNLSVYIDDRVSLIFPKFTKYTVENIKSTYIVDNNLIDKLIVPEITENEVILNDIVNYTSTIYTLNVKLREFTITTIGNSANFEISKPIGKTEYGNKYSVYFYNESFKAANIRVDNGNQIDYSIEELNSTKTINSTKVKISLDSNQNYLLELINVVTNIEITLKE